MASYFRNCQKDTPQEIKNSTAYILFQNQGANKNTSFKVRASFLQSDSKNTSSEHNKWLLVSKGSTIPFYTGTPIPKDSSNITQLSVFLHTLYLALLLLK